MANEIKEIERILAKSRKYITFSERGYILNYIFDLQEDERYFYGQYKDLQQRIDKAIEYIENDIDLTGINGFEKLLNILRGDE